MSISFTWSTNKSSLQLTQDDGDYKLAYHTAGDKFPISNKHFEGLSLSHIPSTQEQVNVFCSNYFFKANKKKAEKEEFFITFFESFNRNNFQLSLDNNESPGNVEKSMGMINFDFGRLDVKEPKEFDKNGLFYRTVCQGLNLEGMCENDECDSFKAEHTVMIPVGLGKHNIAKITLESKCPACEAEIPAEKITMLGFWNCKFRIEGYMTESELNVDRTDTAQKQNYTTFRKDGTIKWSYLEVTTEKPPSSCVIL